jgi:hypothetical protein
VAARGSLRRGVNLGLLHAVWTAELFPCIVTVVSGAKADIHQRCHRVPALAGGKQSVADILSPAGQLLLAAYFVLVRRVFGVDLRYVFLSLGEQEALEGDEARHHALQSGGDVVDSLWRCSFKTNACIKNLS